MTVTGAIGGGAATVDGAIGGRAATGATGVAGTSGAGAAASSAAPMATHSFGWGDSTAGRRNRAVINSLTSGTRDDPPTRTIAASSSGVTPDRRTTRSRISTVSASSGPISSWNSARVSRTRVGRAPSRIGTVVSVSLERASLASVQSRRSRASPVSVSGSSGSSRSQSMPRLTRSNTASSKSTPPSCSIPSGDPSSSNAYSEVRRSTAASNVPPPRSYTATDSPTPTRRLAAKCTAAASGSLRTSIGTSVFSEMTWLISSRR